MSSKCTSCRFQIYPTTASSTSPPLSQCLSVTNTGVRVCVPFSISALIVQHTPGPVCFGGRPETETFFQECVQCGGATPAQHQVLHGSAVFQHGTTTRGSQGQRYEKGQHLLLFIYLYLLQYSQYTMDMLLLIILYIFLKFSISIDNYY